jgi:ABC-type uncharacterized transport system auxiliary subunit
MNPRVFAIGCVLGIIVPFAFAACLPQSAPPKPFYYYTLDYPSPELDLGSHLPVVLRVERFSVSPPFNSQKIFFADKGPYRNAYAHHQWIAAPSELLPFLIARDLRATRAFRAILTPDNSLVPTHLLSGWIEEFLELDQAATWQASLRLNITLIAANEPDPSRRILMQKRYEAQAPCGEKTPAALAQAMGAATGKVSSEVIQDVYDVLSGLSSIR